MTDARGRLVEVIEQLRTIVDKNRIIIGGCLVFLVTFLTFLPDLKNSLLDWDDSGYIIENVRIRTLDFETIRWAFLEFYCNYWAPLTWLSLALDYALWGLNPVGYHLTNNIIHACNALFFFLLSYGILRIYVEDYRATVGAGLLTSGRAFYCALFAAFFFSLHPLRVESVAWATERKDVLSLFFGLIAVLAYLRHVKNDAISSLANVQFGSAYWLMLFFFVLSLLSKAMLVILPVMLLILDWFPFRRYGRKRIGCLLLEKVPLFVAAGLASAVTMRAMAVSSRSFAEINLFSRTFIAFKSIMSYLQLTIWPVNLSPVYQHPGNIHRLSLEYILPLLCFLVVTTFCVLAVKRYPFYLAIWLLYLTPLLPILGFTQNGPQELAGRFTYLPGMSISLLVGLSVVALFARAEGSKPALASLVLSCLMLFGVNTYFTVRQIKFWKDDVALWTRVIDLKPHAFGKYYANRAYVYTLHGDYQHALLDANEALAIATQKQYRAMHEIYELRAMIYKGLKRDDLAISDYTTAMASATPKDRVRYHVERGSLYQKQGKKELAEQDFRMSGVMALQ